jgi:putative endonuclease
MKEYYVYIITNRKNGTLYTGMTNDIERRVYEHKHKVNQGFASKYNCTKLVYFDSYQSVVETIAREKQIKGWLRSKKIALIESMNPDWNDLSEDWHE